MTANAEAARPEDPRDGQCTILRDSDREQLLLRTGHPTAKTEKCLTPQSKGNEMIARSRGALEERRAQFC